MSRIVKFLIYVLVIPITAISISSWLKVPEGLLSFLATLWIIGLVTIAIFFILNINPKKKYKRNITILDWTDDLYDFDERFWIQLRKENIKFNTLTNMEYIKNTVMELTKGNLKELKLYKSFYTIQTKETTEDLYFKSVLVIFSSFIVFSLRNYLAEISVVDINQGFLLISLFFVFIYGIHEKLNFNKKRLALLLEILDLCIDEIEEKEKNEKMQESV